MLNQVQLIGFTGAEPDIRTTQGGKKVATLRVCTSRYTDNEGVERFFSKVVVAMPGHELKSLDRPEAEEGEAEG